MTTQTESLLATVFGWLMVFIAACVATAVVAGAVYLLGGVK